MQPHLSAAPALGRRGLDWFPSGNLVGVLGGGLQGVLRALVGAAAPLVPFLLEGVAGRPRLNLEDGIHPNAEGQKIVAANVLPHLAGLLR